MENYFAQVQTMCEPLVNPFCYYEALVEELQAVPSLTLMTAADFANRGSTHGLNVCLRHDVDSDPLTALRAARHLAHVGASGSFYLLHTSPYYAECHNGVIVRNPELPKWIRGFVVAGCEIGLHNDALGVQTNWNMDGISALREEVKWLRSEGLVIRGTVAHNSGPVYGAENYEIFTKKVLWQRNYTSSLPLGLVDEAELALSYEGTFAIPKSNLDKEAAEAFFSDLKSADIRSESWMRTYLLRNPACDWSVDIQCWLLGKDFWVIAGSLNNAEIFHWNATLKDLIKFLRDLRDSSRILIVLHPEYVRG